MLGAPATTRARTLETGEIAWLAAIPCVLVAAAVVWVLGPPLGSLLFPPLHVHLWPNRDGIRPEPTEQARYLLSLLAPLLVCAAVALAARGRTWSAIGATRALVLVAQTGALLVLLAAIVRQHSPDYDYQISHPYFSWSAAAFAAAFALVLVFVSRSARVRALVADWVRETARRRAACVMAAVLFVVLWLLTAINTDASIGNAQPSVGGMLLWTGDDVYAVLNGRTPLVDFHSQYGSLFPYLNAVPMLALGSSLTVLTTTMAAFTGLTLLAIYDVLRRVVGSSVAALALFLPVVAIGFYTLIGSHGNPFNAANDFNWYPIRVAGPYLLAWVVVRHIDGAWPRRLWPIFAIGGLTVLNNPELGVPALAATVVALVWTRWPHDGRELRKQLLDALGGLAAAIACVTALTLARAGSLPHLGLLAEYSALFVRGGLGMRPMPVFGFHYVLYATYTAALALATVRAAGGRRDGLTAMLAWSAVFGFGSASYFVGESRYLHLIFLFSIWALALVLLLVAVVRGIASHDANRLTPADFAVFVAFGLAVCALAQMPAPWTQIDRIASATPQPEWRDNGDEQFVAADATSGERAAILLPFGHRIAYDLGLVDVAPYSNMEAVLTPGQLDTVVRALRAAGGRRIYYWALRPGPGAALVRAGFKLARVDQQNALVEYVDRAGGG